MGEEVETAKVINLAMKEVLDVDMLIKERENRIWKIAREIFDTHAVGNTTKDIHDALEIVSSMIDHNSKVQPR